MIWTFNKGASSSSSVTNSRLRTEVTPLLGRVSKMAERVYQRTLGQHKRPSTAPLSRHSEPNGASSSGVMPPSTDTRSPLISYRWDCEHYESFPALEKGRCPACLQGPWSRTNLSTSTACEACRSRDRMGGSTREETASWTETSQLGRGDAGKASPDYPANRRHELPPILLDDNLFIQPVKLSKSAGQKQGNRSALPVGMAPPPKLHHIHGLPNAHDHPFVDRSEVAEHFEALRLGRGSPVLEYQLRGDESVGAMPSTHSMPPTPPALAGVRNEMRSGSPSDTPHIRGGAGSPMADSTRRRVHRSLCSKLSCLQKFLCLPAGSRTPDPANPPPRTPQTKPVHRGSCAAARNAPLPNGIKPSRNSINRRAEQVSLPALPPLYFESNIPMTNFASVKKPEPPTRKHRPTGSDQIPILRGGAGSSSLGDLDRLPAVLWFLSGSRSRGVPGTVAAWKQQKPCCRMGGLLGMAVFGGKADEPYRGCAGPLAAAGVGIRSLPAVVMATRAGSIEAAGEVTPSVGTQIVSSVVGEATSAQGPFMTGALAIPSPRGPPVGADAAGHAGNAQ